MGRPRLKPTKVELLPVTRQLLLALPDDAAERNGILQAAGIPISQFFNWKNGYWHPTAVALDRLATRLGKRVVLIDLEPPLDAAHEKN